MKSRYALYGLTAGLVAWWVAEQSAPAAAMMVTIFTVIFAFNTQLNVSEQEDEIQNLKDRLDRLERQRDYI